MSALVSIHNGIFIFFVSLPGRASSPNGIEEKDFYSISEQCTTHIFHGLVGLQPHISGWTFAGFQAIEPCD